MILTSTQTARSRAQITPSVQVTSASMGIKRRAMAAVFVLAVVCAVAVLRVPKRCGPLGCQWESDLSAITLESIQPTWDTVRYIYQVPGLPREVRDVISREFGPSLGYIWNEGIATQKDNRRAIHIDRFPVRLDNGAGGTVLLEPTSSGIEGVEPEPGHTVVWVSIQVERLSWFERIKRLIGL